MRKARCLLAAAVFAICILAAGRASALTGADVALYDDAGAQYPVGTAYSGAWANGVTAIKKMLDSFKITYEVITYTDLNSSPQNFSQLYKIILVPGGFASYYNFWISLAGKQRIRDFVTAGGGYYGICAGAYFAVDRTIWAGTTYDDTFLVNGVLNTNYWGEVTGYDLDLFPGSGTGPMNEIADWNTVGYNMTTVRFSSTSSVLRGYKLPGFTEDILYYGGPRFKADAGASVDVLATYSGTYYNGEPAIVAFAYGSGRVVLSGPHPEIEEDSTRDGVSDAAMPRKSTLADNGSDWPLTEHIVRWLLKPPASNTLWTSSSTGQAIVWRVDPTTALDSANWISPVAGVGAGWQASSYAPVNATTGYVLWTNSGSGQAILWTVNPSVVSSGSAPTISYAGYTFVGPSGGVGPGWQASSYAHVSASIGYVLWTNSYLGQALLWKINPATGAWSSYAWVPSSSGVGAGWQASGYAHVDASTGYVLWTNSSLGQTLLWKINPATGAWSSYAWVPSSSGVGAGWQASSYAHVDASTGYVLWTNSSLGQAMQWKINPATGAMSSYSWISAPSGVGGGWLATSY